MKVLMIGAAFNNATDGNINRGILNILKQKYATNLITDYVFINDHAAMSSDDFLPAEQYNKLIICGTPWLWDQFQHSFKYKNYLLARATHPEAQTILMGIGTCLNISDIDSNILRREEDQKFLDEMTQGATVIVRDKLAHDILNHHEIESHLLPCPAFWAHTQDQFYPPYKVPPVIIWYDPRHGISGADWHNQPKYTSYCKLFTDFYNNNKDCVVYCTDPRDIPGCTSIGLPSPIVLTTSEDSRNAVRFASQVISGRVHCAIPAKAMGVPTYLVPVDSRARSMYDFGEYDGYDKYLKQYMEII